MGSAPGVAHDAGPRRCEHPAASLIPQVRLGTPIGVALCTACGATVARPGTRPTEPVTGL